MGKFRTFDEFLNLFATTPRKKITGGFNVLCPCHADHDPSLSITQDGNKILVNCKAGCSTTDILKAKGLTSQDLFLDNDQYLKNEPIASYTYQNPNGSPRFIIKRFPNTPNGKKNFGAYMPDGTKGIGKTEPILYQAPEVLSAKKSGRIIFVVEGEKDTETLRVGKLVATTPPFGCESKWLPQYTDLLKEANVVILPDTDPPGLKKAHEIALALQGSVASLKLLELQGAKDITEWMESGGTIEFLKELVREQPEYGKLSKPQISFLGEIYQLVWGQENIKVEARNVVESSNGITAEIRIRDTATNETLVFSKLNLLSDTTKSSLIKRLKDKRTADWDGILGTITDTIVEQHRSGNPVKRKADLPEIITDPYRVYPVILEGQPSIYYGYGGSLKSYLLKLIGLLTHNGIAHLGLEPKKGNVLFLDFENDEQTYHRRMKAVEKGLGIGELDYPFYKDCRGKTLPQLLFEIQKQVLNDNTKLVIVDSMTMASGSYEPEQIIAYFRALATLKVASVTVDHRAKGLDKGSSPIGTVLKQNIARMVFEVTTEQENVSRYLNIKNTKNNEDAELPNKSYEVEFEKTGRITTKIAFVGTEPRIMQDTDEDAGTREKLLDYFKSINNEYETPTEITACVGGNANANGKYMRRNLEIFESNGKGKWHIKKDVFTLITKTNPEGQGTYPP